MGWQLEGTEISIELKVSLNWRELLDDFFPSKSALHALKRKTVNVRSKKTPQAEANPDHH